MTKKTYEMDTRVIGLLGLSQPLDREYPELTVRVDYPLHERTEVTVNNAKTVGDVLIQVANFYKKEVYANAEKYGVYGHGLEDLFFEGLEIYDTASEKPLVGVLMGS
jgi:hypothetical protein